MSERLICALERNLAELQKALLIQETLRGIEEHRPPPSVFLRVVYASLFNNYIAHAIKIFEQSKGAASFWYIRRADARFIDAHLRKSAYSLEQLQAVANKLKAIRNGTHFHIDQRGVLDAQAVWEGAALTGKELAFAINFAWEALSEMQIACGGEVPSLLNYSKSDALLALQRMDGTDTWPALFNRDDSDDSVEN